MTSNSMLYWSFGAFLLGAIFVWFKGKELKKPVPNKELEHTAKEQEVIITKPDPPKKHQQHATTQKKANTNGRPKYQDKMAIEYLQYGIMIAATFIGLSTTFWLNTKKADNDRRDRLETVLFRQAQLQNIYSLFLGSVDSIKNITNDSVAFTFFAKTCKNHDYPYFSNLKDPSIFDVSPWSVYELNKMDYQVKAILDDLATGSYSSTVVNIKAYLNIAYKQIDAERRFLAKVIDARELKESSDSLYIQSNAVLHPL